MARPPMGNDIIMSLRYPRDLRDKLRKLAEKERRSLNEQIVYILERWLEQRPDR